jgi:hypothetical protein
MASLGGHRARPTRGDTTHHVPVATDGARRPQRTRGLSGHDLHLVPVGSGRARADVATALEQLDDRRFRERPDARQALSMS